MVTYVADKTFEVKQDSTTQLTVKFDQPLKTLSVADVSVIRTFGTYEYPQQVKSVALAKDGLSATVSVFASFVDKTEYIIKVKGFEDENLTASVGKPVRMELVAKDRNPAFVIYTNTATEIQCVFYDAKDVIVPVTENVSLRLEKLSTTGDYYLAGKKLTIKKNTASAVVVAEYPGWFENGKRVGAFTHSQEFFAEDAPVVVPVAVSDYTIGGFNWWGTVKDMQVSNTDKKLEVKLQRTDNQGGNDVYTFGTSYAPITGASITFTALNPDVCVINTSTGYLTANKPGVASFYVNLKTWNNSSKQYEETPFAVVTVEVKANSYLNMVGVENGAITVGTAAGFNGGKIEIIGYDQYNSAFSIAKTNANSDLLLKVECLSEGYGDKAAIAAALVGAGYSNVGEGLAVDWESWSAKTLEINFTANALVNAMDVDKRPKAGEAATLYFKATYNGNKTTEFAVTVQVPSGNPDDNYIQIMPNASYKDVVITSDSADAKSVEFEVFYMNNGVKVQDLELKAYPAGGADAATEGAYYFKVLKDGQDIWVNTAVAFDASADVNKVTLYPSKTVALSDRAQKAVTAGAVQVSYDGVGAGSYTFALYKCYVESGVNVLVQEFASDVVIAVGDAGQYYISGDQRENYVVGINDATGDDYNKADAAKILSCFNIKDRKGNDVVNPWTGAIGAYTYFVDYTAAANSKYVYVKDVTFYEPVNNGYVAYTVTIDTALERR